MFKRKLEIKLPLGQSAFLWGARQTGKSWFLKHYFKDNVYFDLLDTYEVIRLTKAPYLLRQEIQALNADALSSPIIIDEIQKVPELLNEVHWLIENTAAQFILCGSSSRKLKVSAANLLGGRAWQYNFYPLLYNEIPDFDLLRALSHGLLPKHYLSSKQHLFDNFQAYVDVYLTEEIRNEGLVRNLPAFARFLDVAGLTNSEMLNMNNVARDCGINRSTVQDYYQILIDTYLGYFIYPYSKKVKRDIITATPKFYLFDIGIANYLAQSMLTGLKGTLAGKSFEHFILMELIAYRSFSRKRFAITYWRTKTGLEVDFILGNASIALEVKISEQVHQEDLSGLLAFCEEHPKAKAIVVSRDKNPRKLDLDAKKNVHILPWEHFLKSLWQGEIL